MSKVSETFKPSSDGSIHLPIPPELEGKGRLRVVAWIEADSEADKKTGAGVWATMSAGIARHHPGESPEDARYAALRQTHSEMGHDRTC